MHVRRIVFCLKNIFFLSVLLSCVCTYETAAKSNASNFNFSTMASSLSPTTPSCKVTKGGWDRVLGCTPQALALYRISLGLLLTTELVLRFRFLEPFYSDNGTLPMKFLWEKVDIVYKRVCMHCWSGSLMFEQILLGIQAFVAVLFTIGYKPQTTAFVSWILYFSLTLRNTWLNFILDRYFHFLLWYAIFLPTGSCWSVSNTSNKSNAGIVVSVATILLKFQVLWIYLDAGAGKLLDPLGGWSWSADIPALDSYARHTLGAQYLYALLQPLGLRILTPIVVWVELLAIPMAFIGSYIGNSTITYTAVLLLWGLHIGIAITLRNTVLLSLVACSACCVFLPLGWKDAVGKSATRTAQQSSQTFRSRRLLSTILLISMVVACIWLEVFAEACDQSVKYIWSTLLHNRWNVFVGSEEYVTWEIAPGRLVDGSIVDVWGRSDTVNWSLPGTGAPCTSTSRPGRWRSFPYLAGIEGEEGEILWNYLCKEWNTENPTPERQLVEFNFFMLQADVLPNMGFSATRKRLIHSHKCIREGVDNSEGRRSGNGSSVDAGMNADGTTDAVEASNGRDDNGRSANDESNVEGEADKAEKGKGGSDTDEL